MESDLAKGTQRRTAPGSGAQVLGRSGGSPRSGHRVLQATPGAGPMEAGAGGERGGQHVLGDWSRSEGLGGESIVNRSVGIGIGLVEIDSASCDAHDVEAGMPGHLTI